MHCACRNWCIPTCGPSGPCGASPSSSSWCWASARPRAGSTPGVLPLLCCCTAQRGCCHAGLSTAEPASVAKFWHAELTFAALPAQECDYAGAVHHIICASSGHRHLLLQYPGAHFGSPALVVSSKLGRNFTCMHAGQVLLMALGLTAATVGFIFILATTTTFDFTKAGVRFRGCPTPACMPPSSIACKGTVEDFKVHSTPVCGCAQAASCMWRASSS